MAMKSRPSIAAALLLASAFLSGRASARDVSLDSNAPAPAGVSRPVQAGSGYAGLYHHGSVDTSEDLLILPDHSFCLAVDAGSLDLFTAGRWKEVSQGIMFDEIKPPSSGVIAAWSLSARPEDIGKVTFNFEGYSFGHQSDFVFGTSEDGTTPSALRPLFSANANDFKSRYSLDGPGSIRTFLLAHPEYPGKGDGPYHVVQYHLPVIPKGTGLQIGIYYDEQAAQPPMHIPAVITDGTLVVRGSPFGEPRPLEVSDAARCTAKLKAVEGGAGVQQPVPGLQWLEPVSVTDIVLHIPSTAKPLFITEGDKADPDQ